MPKNVTNNIGLQSHLPNLVGGRRRTQNVANFGVVLPRKMDQLVAQGLFEPWEGTYRITKAGMEKLKELEKENVK